MAHSFKKVIEKALEKAFPLSTEKRQAKKIDRLHQEMRRLVDVFSIDPDKTATQIAQDIAPDDAKFLRLLEGFDSTMKKAMSQPGVDKALRQNLIDIGQEIAQVANDKRSLNGTLRHLTKLEACSARQNVKIPMSNRQDLSPYPSVAAAQLVSQQLEKDIIKYPNIFIEDFVHLCESEATRQISNSTIEISIPTMVRMANSLTKVTTSYLKNVDAFEKKFDAHWVAEYAERLEKVNPPPFLASILPHVTSMMSQFDKAWGGKTNINTPNVDISQEIRSIDMNSEPTTEEHDLDNPQIKGPFE